MKSKLKIVAMGLLLSFLLPLSSQSNVIPHPKLGLFSIEVLNVSEESVCCSEWCTDRSATRDASGNYVYTTYCCKACAVT